MPRSLRWLTPAAVAALIAVIALLARTETRASEEPYRLDETFGAGGVAVTDFAPGNRALAIALQDDGKIVLTGEGEQDNLAIARLNANGTVDAEFANDGLFNTDLVRRGEDVIVLDNGQIMASGNGDEHLVRLLSDGSPDLSFDGDGVTGSQFFNPDDQDESEQPEMVRLIPWAGDRTIVAGTIDYGPYFFTFARYDLVGELDDTFGDEGQVQTDFSPPGDGIDQEPLALMQYDNNRFVAAGYRDVADDVPEDSVIAMYNSNGELDDSFGDDGKTTSDFFAEREEFRELLPQPQGRILAIGRGLQNVPPDPFSFEDTIYLARYDGDGTLNDDFGDNGVIIFDDLHGGWSVEGAALLPDGSIILGGNTQGATFIGKLNPDGTPDPEFGDAGWLVTAATSSTLSQIMDVTVDSDGNIYGAGFVQTPSGQQMAVVKLTNIPLPPVGDTHLWGDNDCNGSIGARDNQALLRNVLSQTALSQTEPCPDIGSSIGVTVPAGGQQRAWGDLDCNGAISARDNQALLRHVLSQGALSQTEPCPDIGTQVLVGGG